jgi:Arc/MetJ-type ribon-helix-helix transcriptional regulator
VAVRLHISLDDEMVADLDARVGRRRRSAFIAEALRRALDERRRWDEIESALGSIPDSGHEWDQDPAAWVRAQRRSDVRAVG